MDMGTIGGSRPIEAIPERHVGLSDPLPRYSGFPWWYALTVAPGQEESSARRLQRLNVFVYLPTYTKPSRLRGKAHRLRLLPIITGMLFIPTDRFDFDRRDEIFDLCRIVDYVRVSDGQPGRLSKAEIERIREIEAELNLHVTTRQLAARAFKIGGNVRFLDDLLAEFWGMATVSAIAKDGRITVEVSNLLGRVVPIVVPAAKIEAM